QFVACVESALHTRNLSRAGIPILFASLPKRLAPLRDRLDLQAQSGLESLSRLRLSPLVRSIRSQVEVPGINPGGRSGWLDLLIAVWCRTELDSDVFHDPVKDRPRNAALVRQGYRGHRFGHEQVINGWTDVEATVVELLRYPPGRAFAMQSAA